MSQFGRLLDEYLCVCVNILFGGWDIISPFSVHVIQELLI